MKKYIINIVGIIGIGVLTLWLLFGGSDVAVILDYFTKLSIRWTVAGFACIVLYWGLETMIQHTLVERMQKGKHYGIHLKW